MNLPKSVFFPRKYLGQFVVDGRLVPDPKKVEALNHTDLLRNKVDRKGKNKSQAIEWTKEHELVVKEAIERLERSVLEIPDESDEFMIETDASEKAIAAVIHIKQGESWKRILFQNIVQVSIKLACS